MDVCAKYGQNQTTKNSGTEFCPRFWQNVPLLCGASGLQLDSLCFCSVQTGWMDWFPLGQLEFEVDRRHGQLAVWLRGHPDRLVTVPTEEDFSQLRTRYEQGSWLQVQYQGEWQAVSCRWPQRAPAGTQLLKNKKGQSSTYLRNPTKRPFKAYLCYFCISRRLGST